MPSGIYQRTETHKKKISDAQKRIGNKPPYYQGKNHPRWKGGISKNINDYQKKWYKNLSYKQRTKISWTKNKRNRVIKRLKDDGQTHTFGEWETLKTQYGFTCPACKRTEPEIKLTEDHIIPLSKGGSDLIENIQPLCLNCNMIKHTKIIKY